ncbi:Hypothetical predicted protein [Octopus vulgaris]|uniref:Uncharacterized protein n=1 Tax=Octopus vulgaris TaxID=6645 RepID=A0AA36EYP7_OCTVU|nr:Hypothetical predicted protein [Octopus vulgaris]
MTEQKEVKSLMEEYKWYDVGETRYAVIEKKNIGEFMGRCERENWEVKDIRMSDEFVENMDEYFGVRMDMEFIRIDKEHSSDYEKQRTGIHFFSLQSKFTDISTLDSLFLTKHRLQDLKRKASSAEMT